MNIYQVLKKPVVSEKGYAQARQGKYLSSWPEAQSPKDIFPDGPGRSPFPKPPAFLKLDRCSSLLALCLSLRANRLFYYFHWLYRLYHFYRLSFLRQSLLELPNAFLEKNQIAGVENLIGIQVPHQLHRRVRQIPEGTEDIGIHFRNDHQSFPSFEFRQKLLGNGGFRLFENWVPDHPNPFRSRFGRECRP